VFIAASPLNYFSDLTDNIIIGYLSAKLNNTILILCRFKGILQLTTVLLLRLNTAALYKLKAI